MWSDPFDVSFVIPFRNESGYIAKTIESLLGQDLRGVRAEVLLVDGMSTDASRGTAEDYARRQYPSLVVRVIDNPEVRTPFGFNAGIAAARAPIIGFGGAHSDYPPHYLRRAVELFREVDAEVIGGGHTEIRAGSRGVLAEAMSCLYKSRMGSGVAAYHTRKEPAYVDTVYGGFYRRELFDRIGTFNGRLVRNQDNELNSRVLAAGGRIYFTPELSTAYVQKTTLGAFLKRAFVFGLYHPSTWRENPRAFKPRHAIPAAFVLYLLTMIVLAAAGRLHWSLTVPLVLYLALMVTSGLSTAARRGILVGLTTIPLFVAYHVLYGAGTLTGIPFALRAH